MCGILGYISFDVHRLKDKFNFALNELEYRGPDGYGDWSSETAILGHRRLSIIDLSDNGKQPMVFQNRFVLSFNGEIYNYLEIRKELESEGFTFRSSSDSEVLLYAYIHWKEKCLNKLNGMWAFAVWDEEEQELFLSRDRVGQKPLFYSYQNGIFAFSSEMKGIYPVLDQMKVNSHLIDRIKQPPEREGQNPVFKYEATSECLVHGIERLKGCHYLRYSKDKGIRITKYWDVADHLVDVPKKYNDQVQQFRELFIDSCRLRLQSDVPTASTLSGGIDSSAVLGGIGYLKQNDLLPNDSHQAFIAKMDGFVIDESQQAKKVADSLGIDYQILNIDPVAEIENIYETCYKFEEIYLANPLPMINTYKAMYDNGIRVSLDGHGGDELFAGYHDDLYASLVDKAPNYWRIKKDIKAICDITGFTQNNTAFNYLKHAIKNKYIKRGREDTESFYYKKVHGFDYLNSSLYRQVNDHGLPTLLRNYDRYSMISSIEVRCPFLDHRIISFAFSIPSSAKFKNGYSKSIVRDALADLVPNDVLYRKLKTGFHPPMGVWLKGKLKTWIQDQVNSADFCQSEIIDGNKLKDQIMNFTNGKDESLNGNYLWEQFLLFAWEKSIKIAKLKL